ncbi:hypothetical protein FI667_g3080, partial [Globisporangium splendens]
MYSLASISPVIGSRYAARRCLHALRAAHRWRRAAHARGAEPRRDVCVVVLHHALAARRPKRRKRTEARSVRRTAHPVGVRVVLGAHGTPRDHVADRCGRLCVEAAKQALDAAARRRCVHSGRDGSSFLCTLGTEEGDEYYCSARGLELCENATDETQLSKLIQIFGTRNESSSDAAAVTSAFLGCQHLFIKNIEEKPSIPQGFLKGLNTSDSVDQWCGEFIMLGVRVSEPINEAPSSSLAAPPSINGARFEEFVNAWQTRLEFDSIMLGIFCLEALLSSWVWKKVAVFAKVPAPSDISQIKYTLATSWERPHSDTSDQTQELATS